MKARAVTRRGFLQAAAAGTAVVAADPAAPVTPAARRTGPAAPRAGRGGEPVRQEWTLPRWPQWVEEDERAWREVLREGNGYRGNGSQVTRFEEE